MDDINQLTPQGNEQLDKLVRKISSGQERVTLSHLMKPRGCAENTAIPDAIHSRLSKAWPSSSMLLLVPKKKHETKGYRCFTASRFTEVLMRMRIQARKDGKRLPLIQSPRGEDEKVDEVVIVVEIDPELSSEFAVLMVLLGERAGDLHFNEEANSQWKMHIITISNESFDSRLQRVFVRRDSTGSQWCFPLQNTYALQWSRHETCGDTSLRELHSSSKGTISCRLVEEVNGAKVPITKRVMRLIRSSNARRIMVLCFRPWARIARLTDELDALQPKILYKFYMEDEWAKGSTYSVLREQASELERMKDISQVVHVVCLLGGSSDTLARSIGTMHGWSMILVLGNVVEERFIDMHLNQAVVVIPKLPCVKEQLDQLSWARRINTTATVIIAAKNSQRLYEHWGNTNIDKAVSKLLFPIPEYADRLMKIENNEMASFVCAVIALDAITGIHAPTVIQMMTLRHDAMTATIESLRYQGIVNKTNGKSALAPMRLRLPPRMGNEHESHLLFFRLLAALGHNYKLALMVSNSLSDEEDSRNLTIIVACALSIGFDHLMDTDELDATARTQRGLESMVELLTGPFKMLASTGTVWLKLALMHKAVWADQNLERCLAGVEHLPASFQICITRDDHKSIIDIPSGGILMLLQSVEDIAGMIESTTGLTCKPHLIWNTAGSDKTLRIVQRRMLDAYILDIVLSRPRTTPNTVYGERCQRQLMLRHQYMKNMTVSAGRALPAEAPDMMFGITTNILRSSGSALHIDELVLIPPDVLLEWHNEHHGRDKPLFDGLISR
ncbi:unnamed protein product [Clonostachys rosea]|uniref:Uncharacterized protein n=1 Tax=Bionectria ochroleuca TaxID=29856 RepID=A0ABY6U1T7_BIOOC|nr:unnamed protein product [Clonostachys rosea]